MKNLFISAVILMIVCSSVFSAEIHVDLDRVLLLTPQQNDMNTESSRIAIYFAIPDTLRTKNIVYAEISLNLDLSEIEIDGGESVEMQAYSITSDWADEDNWNSMAENIDSLSFFNYSFEVTNDSKIFMDVTEYIKAFTSDRNSNFGLMLIPHPFNQDVIHFDQAIIHQISSDAEVKIVVR